MLRRIGLPTDLRSSGYAYQIEMKYRIWRAGGQLAETNILFVERSPGPRRSRRGAITEGLPPPLVVPVFLLGQPQDAAAGPDPEGAGNRGPVGGTSGRGRVSAVRAR